MFDFHQKRKLRALVNSPYTQMALLLLVVWIGWSAYVRYDIAVEMKERRVVAEQQAAALVERRDVLEEQVKYLSEERGIEAELRRQFDVALPGEEVVVIIEEEDDMPLVKPLSTSTELQNQHRWYEFWR